MGRVRPGLPDGRSTRDRRKLAKHVQTLKRNAPRVHILYPRLSGPGRTGEALRQLGNNPDNSALFLLAADSAFSLANSSLRPSFRAER